MNLLNQENHQTLDLAGIGIGPFNLSLAALLDHKKGQLENFKARFFDGKAQFSWHSGLMFPGAKMQTSCFKDLVTPVDPTSRWSFLNYLVSKGRIYDFLSLESFVISRHEFTDYLGWVSHQLENVQFSSQIEAIEYKNGYFQLETAQGFQQAKNLCLGTGKQPRVPECAKPFLSDHCFHAQQMAEKNISWQNKKVVIVGGGQTGSEVFLNGLRGLWGEPASIDWLSRRSNLQPLDESPFTNQYFTPAYVKAFHGLPEQRKQNITDRQKLASDGITPAYLSEMYQELYQRRYYAQQNPQFNQQNQPSWQVLVDRTLRDIQQTHAGYQLQFYNALQGNIELVEADLVILCTGFENRLPDCISPLLPKLELTKDGNLTLDSEFKVAWDGSPDNRIYAVNAGLHSHGIAEPQLSLNAWRAASIINNLLGEEIYRLPDQDRLIDWQALSSQGISNSNKNAA